MVVETGYRVITAPSTAVVNRMIEAVTFHYPLLNEVLITDRNRSDLDWQSGKFTWRYRNRLMVERMFSIRAFHLAPYVAAEPFYESQYSKWASTTSMRARRSRSASVWTSKRTTSMRTIRGRV